jgi:hypothetical protein
MKLSRRLSNTVLTDAAPCSLVDVYRWFGGMCCLRRRGNPPDCIASYSRTRYDVLPSCKVINRRHLQATLLYVPSKCLVLFEEGWRSDYQLHRNFAGCVFVEWPFQVRYSCLTASSSRTQCWKCCWWSDFHPNNPSIKQSLNITEPRFCHKVLCVSYDTINLLFMYALLTDLPLEWWFFYCRKQQNEFWVWRDENSFENRRSKFDSD